MMLVYCVYMLITYLTVIQSIISGIDNFLFHNLHILRFLFIIRSGWRHLMRFNCVCECFTQFEWLRPSRPWSGRDGIILFPELFTGQHIVTTNVPKFDFNSITMMLN